MKNDVKKSIKKTNLYDRLNVIPIIPTLNPDFKLVKYVKELIKLNFKKIIIIILLLISIMLLIAYPLIYYWGCYGAAYIKAVTGIVYIISIVFTYKKSIKFSNAD